MSIEQVIAQGNAIHREVVPFMSESSTLFRLFIGLFVGIAIGMLAFWFKRRDTWQLWIVVSNIVIIGAMLLIQYSIEYDLSISKENRSVSAWTKEVARPYIATLPIEIREIYDVEVKSFEKSLFQPEDEQGRNLSHVVISYQDNGVVQEEGLVEIHSDLKEGENPYISYQILPTDLGHGIDAGEYNQILHLSAERVLVELKTSN